MMFGWIPARTCGIGAQTPLLDVNADGFIILERIGATQLNPPWQQPVWTVKTCKRSAQQAPVSNARIPAGASPMSNVQRLKGIRLFIDPS